jgi:hypothetical protein
MSSAQAAATGPRCWADAVAGAARKAAAAIMPIVINLMTRAPYRLTTVRDSHDENHRSGRLTFG